MTPTHEEIGAILGLTQMSLTTPRRIADVNINFAAHCNTVNVRVFPGGWKVNPEPICDLTAYVGSDCPVVGELTAQALLKRVAEVLERLAEHHNAWREVQLLNAAGTPQTEMEAE